MTVRILQGDALQVLASLPEESVHCCVTSPPYWGLRDYGVDSQLGLEKTPEEYVSRLVKIFREVWRILRDDGTLWLNLGDCYIGARGGGQGKNGVVYDRSASRLGARESKLNKINIPGLKSKDLVGVPWRVAFALQADDWWLRSDIIWSKPNPMPESVTDRPTKSHEYMFLLAKSGDPLLWRHRDTRKWAYVKPLPDYVWRHKITKDETHEPQTEKEWARINLWNGYDYYFDQDAVKETDSGKPAGNRENMGTQQRRTSVGICTGGTASGPWKPGAGRNVRTVWDIATQPFPDAHFATFPPKLIEPCIKAGCPQEGTVLDPFAGAGTTGLVAERLGRDSILIDLNPNYCEMARKRIVGDAPLFTKVHEV